MAFTIISAPIENTILNDANVTQFDFEDTVNDFLYYQAYIFINNTLIDRVVLPRVSNYRMFLEFDNLLTKYLSIPEVGNETLQSFPMINNLRIEIHKFVRVTIPISHVASFLVKTFHYKLAYSYVSTDEQYYIQPLTFIGVDADCFVVSEKTTIRLPFYTINTTDDIVIKIEKENGDVLSQENISNPGIQRTYLANIEVNAPADVSAYFFSVEVGDLKIQKKFRVFRSPLYEAKQVLFRNRFGMPMSLELFGKINTTGQLSTLSYQNNYNELITAEITEEVNIAIDTGYLLPSEMPSVSQLIKSYWVRIKYEDKYVPCIVSQKSIPIFSQNEFAKGYQLQFKFNNSKKFRN